MSTARGRIAAVILCLTLLGFGGYWVWAQVRPYEPGGVADLSWSAGGRPMTATVTVVDLAGKPLRGVKVSVEDDQPKTAATSGTTDPSGAVTLQLDRPAVTEVLLNGAHVMGRPLAGLLGKPS